MTILDRAIGYLAPHVALRRARQRAAIALLARSYEGARLGRRTDGWVVSGAGANAEIGGALVRLRERSRDLVRNNPYAAKAVQAVVSNLYQPPLTVTCDEGLPRRGGRDSGRTGI
jgi:capsid protein